MKQVMQDPWEFYEKFTRCQPLLYFIAGTVLGDSEQAEEAVHNCCRTASMSPRRFQRGNAFHSWLLRVLIDEALLILSRREDPSADFEKTAA
jgi:DNA-directed RNA polymerase specialized sigma24 family protein